MYRKKCEKSGGRICWVRISSSLRSNPPAQTPQRPAIDTLKTFLCARPSDATYSPFPKTYSSIVARLICGFLYMYILSPILRHTASTKKAWLVYFSSAVRGGHQQTRLMKVFFYRCETGASVRKKIDKNEATAPRRNKYDARQEKRPSFSLTS